MPAITIRDVPEETRNELAARAARSGRSLQEFLRAEMIELAQRPDVASVVARARQRKHDSSAALNTESILTHLDADRR
ncbi:hypothetical protein M4I32_12650 [Microbacterium sp. LRZ72]|uniref:FitA-like ribbon-helix-helix domain-containing protein n=1 Tax=Microbacterium sp. LRZ72 TaxID=2942481 RepID=UPI0029B59BCC|nr:hypothetical protein [Microbacterium sp. LRZ72]MDX2377651.1 hypothetical protein [Microbacterium sp. LRZ72]